MDNWRRKSLTRISRHFSVQSRRQRDILPPPCQRTSCLCVAPPERASPPPPPPSIVKDVAPRIISDILADGFEGGEVAERQRAEAAAEAHDILEEVCFVFRPTIAS